MKRGDLLEVEILDVTSAGDGLARVDGQVVFVPLTAVGDLVRVFITQSKKSYARGVLREVLKPGPTRTQSACAYYGRCGGCQYQHLTYSEELRLKEKQVREAFVRIAKMPEAPVLPIVPSRNPYGYRNRITVHVDVGKIGFRGMDPTELIDMENCSIAAPEVNEVLRELRIRRPAAGHYSLRHPDLPPTAFFQANHFLLTTLRDLVVGAVSTEISVCIEAYCGGGFFTRDLVQPQRSIIGIEQDGRALHDARRLGLPRTEFLEAAVEDVLGDVLQQQPPAQTAVILDPPRTGLPGIVRQWLLDPAMRQLIYVSCDPATLARDAADLKQAYSLESVQPIDMFPRTAKVECVTVWKAKG